MIPILSGIFATLAYALGVWIGRRQGKDYIRFQDSVMEKNDEHIGELYCRTERLEDEAETLNLAHHALKQHSAEQAAELRELKKRRTCGLCGKPYMVRNPTGSGWVCVYCLAKKVLIMRDKAAERKTRIDELEEMLRDKIRHASADELKDMYDRRQDEEGGR